MPVLPLFNTDLFDFKADANLAKDFANAYLRQYYHSSRTVAEDETAVYRFIKSVADKLNGSERCLEVGCGPTVHHAMMLAPYVASITMADYLEENLRHVEAWVGKLDSAWDWGHYAEFCEKEDRGELSPSRGAEREDLTRNKISSVLPINLLLPQPLEVNSAPFDLVASFYCTEEVALTINCWQEIIYRVATLVRTRGHLLLVCLKDTDFYHIKGADGEVKALPCASIGEAIFRDTLELTGFDVVGGVIASAQTPAQQGEGVPGVLLAFVQKIRE